MVLRLRMLRCLAVPRIGCLYRGGEKLDAVHLRTRVLLHHNLVTKQRDQIQPFKRRALEARVVQVVAVNVDVGFGQDADPLSEKATFR